MSPRQVAAVHGGTDAPQDKGLPHERDESSSGETRPEQPDNRGIGRKAARDVRRGVEDTSGGPQLDRAYGRVADDTKDPGKP